MTDAYSFSTFAYFRDGNGNTHHRVNEHVDGISDAFTWAKSCCDAKPKNFSSALEISFFQVERLTRGTDTRETLSFIAATKIETCEDRLERLTKEIESIKNAPSYIRQQDDDAILRVLAAQKVALTERCKTGSTILYNEPSSEMVRSMSTNVDTYFFNPDGRLLLLPNGQKAFGYKNLARPSLYSLGRWPENTK